MVYLVTYDLNKEGQRYKDLYELLKKLTYIRDQGLDSVWFISSNLSVQQLTDHIRTVLDNNDRLFVAKLNLHEYNGWMHEDIWEWIRTRL